MNVIVKQLELIDRMDQLIRLQATGSPRTLASRLGISRTTVYRLIDVMKELNAPVSYDIKLQSFVYESAVKFKVGFIPQELSYDETRRINGGKKIKKYIFYNNVPFFGTYGL
ncbi:HTH domain-containing protein [Aquimarina sp. 2201CG1-2-11]|uniref:HTH domain-containing protein n=1 Tax=Aquimarina discodermiae TaxID=3231043 RepID=UPI0034629D08